MRHLYFGTQRIDIKHHNTQHKDTQHCVTQCIKMLNVIDAECCNKVSYAGYHYAECRGPHFHNSAQYSLKLVTPSTDISMCNIR